MDELRLWLLVGAGVVIVVILVWQRYSLWNAALTLSGTLLALFVFFYVGSGGRPIGDMHISLALMALGSVLYTTGILNHKYGRHPFPGGPI